MLSALVLKYRPAGHGDSIDEKGLGMFLILLNVLGGLTLLVFGAFKFLVPRSEEEVVKTSVFDVFTGRQKKLCDRTTSGNDVPRTEKDHVGIELGAIHLGGSDDRGDETFKNSVNPMRKGEGGQNEKVSDDVEKIGVPLPPID